VSSVRASISLPVFSDESALETVIESVLDQTITDRGLVKTLIRKWDEGSYDVELDQVS
jgi:hypothetical protein